MAQILDKLTLAPDIKIWFARAIAGIITADGAVTDEEVAFLREAITFLDSVEEINQIVALVKNRKTPGLQTINIDSKSAKTMLFYIADIAVTDGALSQREIDFFKYIGSKSGIDEALCAKIISWAKDNYQLLKRKEELLE